MLSVRPWVRTVPGTPAPGRVEDAVGLVLAHAFPLRAQQHGVVMAYLLEPGPAPAPVVRAAAEFGVSPRRVRQLVHTARLFARTVPPPQSLLEAARLLEAGGIRTSNEVSAHLHEAGLTVERLPVRALLRISDLFDLPSGGTPRAVGVHAASADRGSVSGERGGAVVLVPLQEQSPLRSYLDGLHLVLRHQVAVPMPGGGGGGHDAQPAPAPSVEVLRASPDALAALIDQDARLHLHTPTAVSGGRSSRRGGQRWVWRAWDRDRQHHGVTIRVAQRLLAVRARTEAQLHEALVGALANLPPSQRYDAAVSPTAVLGAWLEDVAGQGSGLVRTAAGWSWDVRLPRVDEAPVACCQEHGGPVDSGVLLEVLARQGYTTSAARALLSSSPVLQRVAPMKYALK